MKDLLKYSVGLIIVAIPSFLILVGVAYWLVPDFFKEDEFDDYADVLRDDALSYEIHFENDSVKISTVNIPSEEPYIPGITEVWRVNKLKGDSILCVKSNPHYFGRGGERDSIPSIWNVMYLPDKEKLIVEGPTCHAGTIGSYIVDVENGEYQRLPTNNGVIGYTNWDDYIVASSKLNGEDVDVVLWYEKIYILDWTGNIISETSTKDKVIEEGLSDIHYEAGWHSEEIKLTKHIGLKPQYPDSLYYGNEFHVKYQGMAMKELANLGSSNSLPEGWCKHGKRYYYYSNDNEYGLFVTILVDSNNNTGIIRKGAYTNPKNKPKRQYE